MLTMVLFSSPGFFLCFFYYSLYLSPAISCGYGTRMPLQTAFFAQDSFNSGASFLRAAFAAMVQQAAEYELARDWIAGLPLDRNVGYGRREASFCEMWDWLRRDSGGKWGRQRKRTRRGILVPEVSRFLKGGDGGEKSLVLSEPGSLSIGLPDYRTEYMPGGRRHG